MAVVFIRLEIAAARRRRIAVIPVLIDDAEMPDKGDLPEDLRQLTTRQGMTLDFRRFDAEIGRLVAFLRKVLRREQSEIGFASPAPRVTPAAVRRAGAAAPAEDTRAAAVSGDAGEAEQDGKPPTPNADASVSTPDHPDAQSSPASGSRRTKLVSLFGWGVAGLVVLGVVLSRLATNTPGDVRPSLPATSEAPPQTRSVAIPKMITLPGGRYRIGSPPGEAGRADDEGPQKDLSIAAFMLGATPVTRGQFAAFVEDTNYASEGCYVGDGFKLDVRANWRKPGFEQDDTHPVVCVNWEDAQSYVKWLSRRTGQTYRLPSEAEWEYSARAGTTTARYWGDDADRACGYANVADQETEAKVPHSGDRTFHNCRDGWAYTAPADYGKANAFRLPGMLGNVWQWTENCWHENYEGRPSDRMAWMHESNGECGRRVVRGGCWLSGPAGTRSAIRNRLEPGDRYNHVGFRVARNLP